MFSRPWGVTMNYLVCWLGTARCFPFVERRKDRNGRHDGLPTMSFAKRSTTVLMLSAVLSLGYAPILSAQSTDISIPMDEKEVRFAGITTTTPDKEQREIELSFPGTVVIPPQQLRVVAAPANGLVESLLAVTDEPVQAGQPVAQLRSMELVEAQRQYLAALADEALASDRAARLQMLVEARATPERELRVAQTTATNARAHLDER